MPLPSTAKLLDVIAKLQDLTGITQIPVLKEALQSRGINLTGNETMVDLVQIVKDNNFNNTADATAAAGQILSGQTAYVKGVKVTGSMPNNAAVTITPGAADQTIQAGYHNGAGVVKGVTVPTSKLVEGNMVAGQAGTLKDYSREKLSVQGGDGYYVDPASVLADLTGTLLIVAPKTGYYTSTTGVNGYGSIALSDPNFVKANILSGKSIFGLAGTALPRAFGSGTAQSASITSTYNYLVGGTVVMYKVQATHGLDWTPKCVVIMSEDSAVNGNGDQNFTIYLDYQGQPKNFQFLFKAGSGAALNVGNLNGSTNVTMDSQQFVLPYNSGNTLVRWWAFA
ncbi:hypothetical protein [Paenibacillus sp. Y412MC10]|uniref:hypothetical protein n=1 Tax=Geobacillus sp. (strain Y412MC10) TaxID=481743 RepID=UPI00119CE4E8|nr:hypothetical protein [Paenibacillus sp. Y412MC10]